MFSYTPLRKEYSTDTQPICALCDTHLMQKQTLTDADGNPFENTHCRWIYNNYPKFDGHTMIVPKRHIEDIAGETQEEILARQELLNTITPILMRTFDCDGLEVFMQYGTSSERSIKHLHWHIVPARTSDPLRSFQKLGHFYTTKEHNEICIKDPFRVTVSREILQEKIKKYAKLTL